MSDPHSTVARNASRDIRTLWRWLVPAALLLAGLFVFVFYSVLFVKRESMPVRGSYKIECREPKGEVAQYTTFRSRGGKPAGGWFRFEIFDVAAPNQAVLSADHIDETRWTPPNTELAKLPARIRWRVAAIDAQGIEIDADETNAWLQGSAPR